MENMKTIYIAAGCFWGAEKYFSLIEGVCRTEVGYANGETENPSYEDVKHRGTGHAETVLVEYDPAVISLSFLLDLYYQAIDPASLNRQGADVGTQYRTGIYYTDQGDLPVIKKSLEKLRENIGVPVAIEVKPLENFYTAEEYHQKYLEKNPGGYCHIDQALFDQAKAARPI
ncbi:MAG: peptide-methionine (S)-S-oxide reductase MsrA [Spirochaetaceae bacterium]|jgi:peptide methionine sulfoxide reductase msrA/msrB|nr:peptide-methionine (S)-S-oxide reductase MsrA [Spirochaetaceae bacterium]